MRLILHVGMGKTGTSSIQKALEANQAGLKAQKAHYLGMWFDFVDPRFHGIMGMRDVFDQTPEALEEFAGATVESLREIEARDEIDTFILSNEDLFGKIRKLDPFLSVLKRHLDLSIVIYVRDIHSWLPSAYAQWGIHHKVQKGPVKTFAEDAPRLVKTYRALALWQEKHGEHISFRKYDKSKDVVEDLAEAIGKRLEPAPARHLERGEPVELLLRAAFNTRFQGEVFPGKFNRAVVNTQAAPVPRLETAIENYLDYSTVDAVIAPDREVLERISAEIGIDFLSGDQETSHPPRRSDLEDRLLDYMITIMLNQAQRIQVLENAVRDLKAESD